MFLLPRQLINGHLHPQNKTYPGIAKGCLFAGSVSKICIFRPAQSKENPHVLDTLLEELQTVAKAPEPKEADTSLSDSGGNKYCLEIDENQADTIFQTVTL